MHTHASTRTVILDLLLYRRTTSNAHYDETLLNLLKKYSASNENNETLTISTLSTDQPVTINQQREASSFTIIRLK